MIRRALAWLLSPLYRTLVRHLKIEDPWERLYIGPRLALYGSGARHEFSHYLEGPSAVEVGSIDEIVDWLLGCRYESDEALFHEPDFWQHPTTFEHLRAGDCEDFAIWAWRKLLGLGIDADLVAGYTIREDRLGGRHAWVVFRHEGRELVLEPTERTRARMVRPLADVGAEYVPQVGVDRTARRFSYAGSLVADQRRIKEADPSSRRSA